MASLLTISASSVARRAGAHMITVGAAAPSRQLALILHAAYVSGRRSRKLSVQTNFLHLHLIFTNHDLSAIFFHHQVTVNFHIFTLQRIGFWDEGVIRR